MNKLKEIANDIFMIEDFLSEEECQNYISCAESIGFTAADVYTGSRKEIITYIRNNERVDYHSDELANELWNKLSGVGLPKFDFMSAISLSPFFRFYKYLPGQKFNMHKDGQQRVGENITYFTMMIYLNDSCEGGDTVFRLDDVSINLKSDLY
jgi:prolyl 4-hydroxylase